MTIYRLVVLLSALLTCLRPCACATRSTESVGQLFNTLRKSPPELYAFLLKMPKGADLHNHLSGAVYAETFLQEAAAAHVCLNRQTLSFTEPSATLSSCGDNQIADAASLSNGQLASDLIDSLSMRDFVPGRESPHDHFFNTFSKFGAVSHLNDGDYLAEVVSRAAEQNESYLELMALSAGSAISNLGRQAGLDADFEITRQKLLRAGLQQQAASLKSSVDELERARIAALKCESQPDSPPCRVTVRYIFQVLRGNPKEQVFAQVLAGFMLASIDPRVVAVNFVQPEDSFTSMHDYHLHMRMVDFAKRLYPNVHISLHAGELASGMVPPEGLRFHIREAAEIGHAERIGHGVDIMYENGSLETLRFLHNHHIDIEINLTSNDAILGVKGYDHPFPIYRKYGVPVTLSTDDEGVSRTHLTQEYQRAVLTYGLTYSDVKQIVRNSLEYAFLPGQSLWKDSSYRTMAASCAVGRHTDFCNNFLAANEKAALQSDLEDRFTAFETSVHTQ
jgi:adenosine deaminase